MINIWNAYIFCQNENLGVKMSKTSNVPKYNFEVGYLSISFFLPLYFLSTTFDVFRY